MDDKQEHQAEWGETAYPHLVQFLDRLDAAGLMYQMKVRSASVRVSIVRPPRSWDLKFTNR